MKEGYLILTSFNWNEIEAVFTEDKEIFRRLCIARAVESNEKVLNIWSEYIDPDNNNKKFEKDNRFTTEALGESGWPFNGVKILGVFYMDVY